MKDKFLPLLFTAATILAACGPVGAPPDKTAKTKTPPPAASIDALIQGVKDGINQKRLEYCSGSLLSNPLCDASGLEVIFPPSVEESIREIASQRVYFESGKFGPKQLNPALQAVIENAPRIVKNIAVLWKLDANMDPIPQQKDVNPQIISDDRSPQDLPVVVKEITDYSPLFNTSVGGQPEMVAIVGSGIFSLHDAAYYENDPTYHNLPKVIFEPDLGKSQDSFFYTARGQVSAPNTLLTAMKFDRDAVEKVAAARGHIKEAVFVSPKLPLVRASDAKLLDWEDGMLEGLRKGTIERAVIVSPLVNPYFFPSESVVDPNKLSDSQIDIGNGLTLTRKKIPVEKDFPFGSLLFAPRGSARSKSANISVWWTEITRKK